MSQNIYDIIIIWAWAAGMFTAINAPKNAKKCILEKTGRLGTKVLMSGGERCNVSNIDIEAERDYFGKNTKAMYSPLSKFSNYDMIDWLESRSVRTHIEDRGRIILHSGRALELVKILEKELHKNKTEILYNSAVSDVSEQENGLFEVSCGSGKKYIAKKVVVSSGGKSFAKVWTDGWWYSLAKKYGIKISEPYRWLCGMVTKQDLSEISGSTIFVNISLMDGENCIYNEIDGSFLFTHFWVSWPMIYNTAVALGSHLRNKNIKSNEESQYIRQNISLRIDFQQHSLTKKLQKFFSLWEENMSITLNINDLRSWNEAKVTGWGIELSELTNSFESKKLPGLYFIWEVIDITGKTGGFNLQSAWSQGYVVGKSL